MAQYRAIDNASLDVDSVDAYSRSLVRFWLGYNKNCLMLRRILLPIALFCLTCWASAQTPEQALDALVAGFKPGAMIVVKKHPTGADMVQVTMLSPTYSSLLLKQQCLLMGQLAGSESRGVTVWNSDPQNPSAGLLKASFATDHLIDRTTGTLALQPIAQAFAGVVNEHKLEGILVSFDGEQATARTLRSFASTAVALKGAVSVAPPGLEYRIRYLTDQPNLIQIPQQAAPPETKKVESAVPSRTNPVLYAIIALGSVAAGCLVYLAFLGSGRSGSTKKRTS